MSDIVVRMSSEEAQLWAGLQKVTAGFKGMEDAADKTGRAAKRIYDQTRTPQERYNEKLAEANRLLEKNKISQDTYNRAVQKYRSELDAAGKKGQEAFGPAMLSSVRSLAGAMGLGVGLAGAVAQVRKEIENYMQVQERARQATMTVAQAQRAALRNLGATSDEERQALEQRVLEIAGRTGMSVRDVYTTTSDALSARGDLSVDQTMVAVEQAARLAPSEPEVARTLAGASLDLMKLSPGASSQETLGFLSQVGQMARITDTYRIARNAPVAINALVGTGSSMQESGALFAAITQSMKDFTGESSATATIDLNEQLRRMFSGEIASSKDEVEAWKKMGLPQLEGYAAQLEYLQQNPEAREFMLSRLTGEKKALTTYRELLSGTGSASAALRDFRQRMPGMDEAGQFYESSLSVMDAAELQKTAALERSLSVASDRMALSNQEGARFAILRDNQSQILASAGLMKFQQQLASFTAETDPQRFQTFIERLQKEQARLEQPYDIMTGGGGFGANFAPASVSTTQRTPQELRQAETLAEVIPALERMFNVIIEDQRAAARAQREAAESLNRAAEKVNGSPTLGSPTRDQ